MSIKNKISVISISVGVMFLGVSTSAMENSEKKEESKSSLDESRNIINSEKEKEVNDKKIGEAEQKTTKLNEPINNQEIEESNSEIKSEEKLREELREYGYGDTKEEQEKIKNWITFFGVENEEIFEKMRTKKYKNIIECIVALIKEKIKKFSEFIDILAKYPFKYKTNKGSYEEEDEYEDFEVINADEFETVLKLIGEDYRLIICNYIDELCKSKEARGKIKNYKQLVWNALIDDMHCGRGSKRSFGLNDYKERFRIYKLNFINRVERECEGWQVKRYIDKNLEEIEEEEKESLTKDKTKKIKTYEKNIEDEDYSYEEKVKLAEEIKEKKDREKIEKREKEMKDINVSETLKNNEYVRWAKLWIELWGGDLIELCKKNKPIKLENIKEYLKEVVGKEIKGFDKVLDRFLKYKCEFNKTSYENIDLDEFEKLMDKPYTYVPFVNFKKIIKEIKKENKEIEKEYGFKINEREVFRYLTNEVRFNNSLMEEIKNYKQLIWNAYKNLMAENEKYHMRDRDMRWSNLNTYKFYRLWYNLVEKQLLYPYAEFGSRTLYTGWKQGRYDIYKKDSLNEIEEEYEEMQFILEMKKNLEEIKEMDGKELLENVNNILKKYSERECSGEFGNIEGENNISSCFKKLKYYIVENIIKKSGKNVKYFKGFVMVLKQFINEGLGENFIDEIIDLTKEEYYPGRFIEKFTDLILYKYRIQSKLEYLSNSMDKLIDRIEENDEIKDDDKGMFDTKDAFDRYTSWYVNGYRTDKCYGFDYKKDKYDEFVYKKDKYDEFHNCIDKEISRLPGKRDSNFMFFEYFYMYLFKELSFKYKQTFFEKLGGILENKLKGMEEIKDIAFFIKGIKEENINKEDVKNLIEKIKDNIGVKYIVMLNDKYKLTCEGEETFNKYFFDKILNLANDFVKENLLDFDKSKFFKRLEKLIEDFYMYKESTYNIRKMFSEILNLKKSSIDDNFISDSVVEYILGQFKNIITGKTAEKFRYILKNLTYKTGQLFSNKMIYLIDFCSGEDELKKILSSLIEEIYEIDIEKKECSLVFSLNDICYKNLIKFLKEEEKVKEEIKEEKNFERISDEDFYSDYFSADKEDQKIGFKIK